MGADIPLHERLSAHGVRRTPQRVAILRTLAETSRAVGAAEVHRSARAHCAELGLTTVYRTLIALSDAGLVDVIDHHDGEATYRLCGERHHHHLVCEGCREVIELPECDLREIERAIATEHGFQIDSHELSFYGRCSACR